MTSDGRPIVRGQPEATGGYRPVSSWPPILALAVAGFALLSARVLAEMAVLAMVGSGLDRSGALMIATLFQQALVIVAVLWLALQRDSNLADTLALRRPVGGLRVYLISFVVLISAAAVMSAAVHAYDSRLLRKDLDPFAAMLASPLGWLVFPMVGIGAPLSEELLFRGFLFAALARSAIGVWGASLVTSAGWALAHAYSPIGMAQVFLIGLVFSWMLVRSGSLRVPIVSHAVYNCALAAIMATEVGKGVLRP